MAKLTINEAANGYTHAFRFNYVDLQTSGFLSTLGAANQKIIGSQAPGDIIKDVCFYMITADAGASDITLDFGTTNTDPDEYIDNADVDGMTKVIYNTGDAFVGSDSGSPPETTSNVVNGVANNTTSAKPLYIEVNGTHGDLTAGEWVLCWNQLSAEAIARAYGA